MYLHTGRRHILPFWLRELLAIASILGAFAIVTLLIYLIEGGS
jgi:hypothetical protein